MFVLNNPRLASTEESRLLLQYLVQCALQPSQSIETISDGKKYAFRGVLGLADHWLHTALTESGQRWVSACLLARVNLYGRKVEISLRAPNLLNHSINLFDEFERREFHLHEGGFFGNVFLEDMVAYSCQGIRNSAAEHSPVLAARRCTELSGERDASGQSKTQCQFVSTGHCTSGTSQQVGDERWTEIVHVYLKPGSYFLD